MSMEIATKKVIYVDSLSHHGVKGMKWGVRKIEKYSKKAKKQRDYHMGLSRDIRKNGDWEDDEYLQLLTPKEQKEEWNRSQKVAQKYLKTAQYWDVAYKDISKSSSSREAKDKYKKYRRNSEIFVPFP